MGSMSDKAAGLGNQVAGRAKEGVGKMTGDTKLEAEGKAQDLKGKAQKTVGDVKDAANRNL